MCFENISFIKPDRRINENFSNNNIAPLFRKSIYLNNIEKAVISICCLGIGYCYINGKQISNDLFTAPCSDYMKTLWYNEYDVSSLLEKGENTIAVWCGNGWYNEEFKTDWEHYKAKWRDVPKFIFKLVVDGKTVLVSDNSWKCMPDSAVWFNALRSGEYFDARKYDPDWTQCSFDDSNWEQAIIDINPPSGIFRKCLCEPIYEAEEYKPVKIYHKADDKFVYDLGQNISGYVRMKILGREGQMITIRYSEQINDDYSRQLNNMDKCYIESDFQTDKFICSGKFEEWSPRFTYHGFRYVEIEGITNTEKIEVSGIFVHQKVEKKTEFECSDEFLNKLFKATEMSVYSNMFYALTDCPTREKLGWMNDAQSSAENILLNFDAEAFFEKWLQDIYDAMRDDGALPGIVPTPGWGYEWGNGPVSDGALFEIPYRIYMITGNAKPLIDSLPYFEKYFKYLDSRRENELIKFGLSDWAKPGFLADWQHCDIPTEFINAVLEYGFCEKAALARRLSDKSDEEYIERKNHIRKVILDNFIDENGKCIINKQTAVAMLICFKLYDDMNVLKKQIETLVKESNFHHDCGMVGMRWLSHALEKCGLSEYAYMVITAEGYPGYKDWLNHGATTLWEYWDWNENSDSKNHHMYSDVMNWITKNIIGISNDKGTITINPYYYDNLNFVKGSYKTKNGKIFVSWQRNNDVINLTIDIPKNSEVYYKNEKLNIGKNIFNLTNL